MQTENHDQLIDLGDAVAETKGSQIGKADVGAGQQPLFGGLSSDD